MLIIDWRSRRLQIHISFTRVVKSDAVNKVRVERSLQKIPFDFMIYGS
jgi:hypothetical protein